VGISVQLLSQWISCLGRNTSYCEYWDAKDYDLEICKRLEAEFPCISELSTDFGRMPQAVLRNDKAFQRWMSYRWAMFFTAGHIADVVTDVLEYQFSAGFFLASIPLFEEKHKTIKEVTKMLDYVYANREKIKASQPVAELMMSSLPKTKYKLHGEVNEATKRKITKSIYIGELQRREKSGKPLSLSDTVIHILLDPINPMGDDWKMSDEEQSDYQRGRLKKTELYESKRKQVRFYREQYDRLVANTIYGRFPDFS
jgi:hypothetical protein